MFAPLIEVVPDPLNEETVTYPSKLILDALTFMVSADWLIDDITPSFDTFVLISSAVCETVDSTFLTDSPVAYVFDTRVLNPSKSCVSSDIFVVLVVTFSSTSLTASHDESHTGVV